MHTKKSTTLRNQRGFTLIEILVVVVILGILAGIVVPRLLGEPEKARRTKAEIQIRGFDQALASFKLDNGFFPSTEQELKALVEKPRTGKIPNHYREKGYIKKIPLDPWGNPYIYLSPGIHDDYDIMSYGPDGASGGDGDDADINSWEIE
jgi:general secretion pathway protein G